jgi:hypothetical protein
MSDKDKPGSLRPAESGEETRMRIDAGASKGPTLTTYTEAEWKAEGERRFGADVMKWRFVCPICKNIAAVEDFKPFKGADPNSATCECIGRYKAGKPAFERKPRSKPCDYAGYGLFRLSPVRVIQDGGKEIHCFAFAEAPATASPASPGSQQDGAKGQNAKS